MGHQHTHSALVHSLPHNSFPLQNFVGWFLTATLASLLYRAIASFLLSNNAPGIIHQLPVSPGPQLLTNTLNTPHCSWSKSRQLVVSTCATALLCRVRCIGAAMTASRNPNTHTTEQPLHHPSEAACAAAGVVQPGMSPLPPTQQGALAVSVSLMGVTWAAVAMAQITFPASAAAKLHQA